MFRQVRLHFRAAAMRLHVSVHAECACTRLVCYAPLFHRGCKHRSTRVRARWRCKSCEARHGSSPRASVAVPANNEFQNRVFAALPVQRRRKHRRNLTKSRPISISVRHARARFFASASRPNYRDAREKDLLLRRRRAFLAAAFPVKSAGFSRALAAVSDPRGHGRRSCRRSQDAEDAGRDQGRGRGGTEGGGNEIEMAKADHRIGWLNGERTDGGGA